MKYVLDKNIALRSWIYVPYAYYIKGDELIFIDPSEQGGDADTLAAITGSVAEAFYKYASQAQYQRMEKKLFLSYFVDARYLRRIVKSFSSSFNYRGKVIKGGNKSKV